MTEKISIPVVTKILDANSRIASEIRHHFQHHQVLAFNMISSPGSGKTTLLETVLPILKKRGIHSGVIAADIATTADADRLAKHHIPVIQITTESFGGACHLEAAPVRQALENFPIDGLDFLFIENVGNLVCPAEFDVGESLRMVMLSVTEGEDKPLKYPLAFHVSQFAVISKVDLIPYLQFSKEKLYDSIKKVNPTIHCFEVSCTKDIGIESLVDWFIELNHKKDEYLYHQHTHPSGSSHSHGHSHSH